MPDGSVDWAKWAYVIAALSLLWNLANSFYTHNVDTASKRRSINLEEFRNTVRDPIRKALDALDSIVTQLRGLTNSDNPSEELRSACIKINQEAVEKLGNINDALHDANASRFADGSDWLDGFSNNEDAVLNLFNSAINPNRSEVEMRADLAQIPGSLRSLREDISGRLERQVERYSQ